jgi:hypothetical protein
VKRGKELPDALGGGHNNFGRKRQQGFFSGRIQDEPSANRSCQIILSAFALKVAVKEQKRALGLVTRWRPVALFRSQARAAPPRAAGHERRALSR